MSDYRIMNLTDKWKEATYHLSLMKKSGKLFTSTDDTDIKHKQIYLRDFRYEFNAFVNCCRSVTFVLQKTFKKHEAFNEWYEAKQNLLADNTFAKALLKLRNMNQKEGNYYPHVISISRVNDDFTFRSKYSAVPEKIYYDPRISKNLINANFHLEKNPNEEDEIIDYAPPDGATYKEIRNEMQKILVAETIKDYNQKFSKVTEEDVQNMTFLRYEIRLMDEPNLSMDDFLEKCLNHIYLLRDICKESQDKFLT